jgi:hypothetical protein
MGERNLKAHWIGTRELNSIQWVEDTVSSLGAELGGTAQLQVGLGSTAEHPGVWPIWGSFAESYAQTDGGGPIVVLYAEKGYVLFCQPY